MNPLLIIAKKLVIMGIQLGAVALAERLATGVDKETPRSSERLFKAGEMDKETSERW